MRHGMNGGKFHRTKDQRKALFRGLVINLIERERITTTLAKAKNLRPIFERFITLGKKGSLHHRRLALSRLNNNNSAVMKLFAEIAPRLMNRNGGYTRIVKAGFRKGDSAPMALIELVDKSV